MYRPFFYARSSQILQSYPYSPIFPLLLATLYRKVFAAYIHKYFFFDKINKLVH